MPRIRTIVVVLAVLALGGATVAFAGASGGGDEPGHDDHGNHHDDGERGGRASATLRDAAGATVGRVWMHQRRGGVVHVLASVRGLSPGFHGFHVHTAGVCEAPFTSAGAHFQLPDEVHGGHAGDLPSLLVADDGTATLTTATYLPSIAALRGTAVIVHDGRDNFANIPPRYQPPADATTLATGDSGARIACGVVR